jgi:hypothetical protein
MSASANLKTTTTNVSEGPTLTPYEVIAAVDDTVIKALEAGDLHMYDSEVHDVTENGLQVSVISRPEIFFYYPIHIFTFCLRRY